MLLVINVTNNILNCDAGKNVEIVTFSFAVGFGYGFYLFAQFAVHSFVCFDVSLMHYKAHTHILTSRTHRQLQIS